MARAKRQTWKGDLRPVVDLVGLDSLIEQIGKKEIIEQMGKKHVLEQMNVHEILENLPPAKRRALQKRLNAESSD